MSWHSSTKYKEHAVEKFAGEVMLTARMIWRYRQVYKFYENCTRVQFLSFNHHFVAMFAPDPAAALKMAEDEGLSAANIETILRFPEASI